MALWKLVEATQPCGECGTSAPRQVSLRRPDEKGACVLCMARSFEGQGEDKIADLLYGLLDDEFLQEQREE